MRWPSPSRSPVVGAVVFLALLAAVHTAAAYPLRAYMIGKQLKGRDLFYVQFVTGDDRQGGRWLIDLSGAEPLPPAGPAPGERDVGAEEWDDLNSGLMVLPCLGDFDLSLSLKADSVGVDTLARGGVYHVRPRYEGDLVVTTAGRTKAVHLVMFCDTLIKMWGVFEIPGYSEVIVLISYKSSRFCNERALPVVIPAR